MNEIITIDLAEMSDENLADLLSEISRELNYRLHRDPSVWGSNPVLDENERCLVYQGKNVEAIKAYRNRTRLGLAESKGEVDNFRQYMEVQCS